MKLSKNAVGLAVAAAIGFSGQANAIMEGVAGEGLLIPFVLFNSGDHFDRIAETINTLIEVTIPASIGKDTIPNYYTAPHTTPTTIKDPYYAESEAYLSDDPDLGREGEYTAAVHAYFFDERSNELWNDSFPVSPDDFLLINWGDIVVKQAQLLDGVKGYMVITNDKEYVQDGADRWRWTDPARFSMFGDAFMMWPAVVGLIDTKIPVLPMSDGDDNAVTAKCPTPRKVCVGNEIVHNSDGTIADVSPLVAGMRIGRSDGVPGDFTLFDLTMSNRFLPTLHVIWMDQNINQNNTGFVFNDVEQSCSNPLPILNELNVIWTSPHPYFTVDTDPNQPGAQTIIPAWVDVATELCYPDGAVTPPVNFLADPTPLDGDIFFPGFARFKVNEYLDNNINAPETAGVAFSIQLQIDVLTNDREEFVLPQLLPIETALGHERGTFAAF